MVCIYPWNFILNQYHYKQSHHISGLEKFPTELLTPGKTSRDEFWRSLDSCLLFYFLLKYQLNNASGGVKRPTYDGLSNKLNKFTFQLKYSACGNTIHEHKQSQHLGASLKMTTLTQASWVNVIGKHIFY